MIVFTKFVILEMNLWNKKPLLLIKTLKSLEAKGKSWKVSLFPLTGNVENIFSWEKRRAQSP